eukprot:TRINITY_DN1296_c0_g1_i12.p1 TRINITY_DN1296_c0_g1~~TRINITY_DN1296_c0_g1_i12.p1  ORF type:complete len:446 (-),score=135.88 TRINITY_DN1296_c0_g1_i12:107-1444(-)
MSTRKQTLKSSSEEYLSIRNVVLNYAIHNSHISISFKKVGKACDIATSKSGNVKDNISQLIGPTVGRELIDFSIQGTSFIATGWVTNATYNQKHSQFILFVNGRLVESASLKKGIESVYSSFLPKRTKPFLYVSIKVDPNRVDVNIHPTKAEVQILDEDQVFQSIQQCINHRLLQDHTSRTFFPQAIPSSNATSTDHPIMPSRIIPIKKPTKKTKTEQSKEQALEIPSSVMSLIEEFELRRDEETDRILRNATFVGCVDEDRIILQSHSKVYLVHAREMSRQMAFQSIIKNFGNFEKIVLDPPIPLHQLLLLADDQSHSSIQAMIQDVLEPAREILEFCFKIVINQELELEALPRIYVVPDVTQLPCFISGLASRMTWEEEEDYFRGVASLLADLTSLSIGQSLGDTTHPCFPIGPDFVPPDLCSDGYIVEIASLGSLFKMFERC